MSKRTKKVGISGKVCEINSCSPLLSLATLADARAVRHKVRGLDTYFLSRPASWLDSTTTVSRRHHLISRLRLLATVDNFLKRGERGRRGLHFKRAGARDRGSWPRCPQPPCWGSCAGHLKGNSRLSPAPPFLVSTVTMSGRLRHPEPYRHSQHPTIKPHPARTGFYIAVGTGC